MTHLIPVKYTPGDALDKFVILKVEDAIARLMGVDPNAKRAAPKVPGNKRGTRSEHAQAMRDKLLACIKKHGPMPQREMVAHTGMNANRVSYHLSRLISAGLVENPDPTRRTGIYWRAVK